MAKSYYRIIYETNPKIVGPVNQSKGLPLDFDYNTFYNSVNSMTNLTNNSFPSFEPNLVWELQPKAILTDVVNPSMISSRGLLMNISLKERLEKFNLWDCKFLPAKVYQNGVQYEYFWLHVVDSKFEGVNMEESTFVKTSLDLTQRNDVKISTIGDYDKELANCRIKPFSFISCNSLKLTNDYSHFHLFYKSVINITALIIEQELMDCLSHYSGIRCAKLGTTPFG